MSGIEYARDRLAEIIARRLGNIKEMHKYASERLAAGDAAQSAAALSEIAREATCNEMELAVIQALRQDP